MGSIEEERLATVETDGRLVLTGGQHEVGWLSQDEGELAIRIRYRGCLYMKPLRTIAELLGATEAEAKESLNSLGSTVSDPYALWPVCWGTFTRKKGRGVPVYRIRLPAKALWALFGTSEGPIRTGKAGQYSTRVLVRPQDGGLVVWSHRGWPLVRTDVELSDFGI